jgi:hypothetical protein
MGVGQVVRIGENAQQGILWRIHVSDPVAALWRDNPLALFTKALILVGLVALAFKRFHPSHAHPRDA